jgi:hypothetical protein
MPQSEGLKLEMNRPPLVEAADNFQEAYRYSDADSMRGKAMFALVTAGTEGLYPQGAEQMEPEDKEEGTQKAAAAFMMGAYLDDAVDIPTKYEDGQTVMDSVAMPFLVAQTETGVRKLKETCTPEQEALVNKFIEDYSLLKLYAVENQEHWNQEQLTQYREIMDSMCIRLGFSLYFDNRDFATEFDWSPYVESTPRSESKVYPWYQYMQDKRISTQEDMEKYLEDRKTLNPFRQEVLDLNLYARGISEPSYEENSAADNYPNFEKIRQFLEENTVNDPDSSLLTELHNTFVPPKEPQDRKQLALRICFNIIMASQSLNDLETSANEALGIKTMASEGEDEARFKQAQQTAVDYMQEAYDLGFPRTWGSAFFLLGVNGWDWVHRFADLTSDSVGREVAFDRMFLRQKLQQINAIQEGTRKIADVPQEETEREQELKAEIENFREEELQDLQQSRRRVLAGLWDELKTGTGAFEENNLDSAVRGYETSKKAKLINAIMYLGIGTLSLAIDRFRSRKTKSLREMGIAGKIVHGVIDTLYNRGSSFVANAVEGRIKKNPNEDMWRIITPSAYITSHIISLLPWLKDTSVSPLTTGAFLRALDQVPFLGAFSERIRASYDQTLIDRGSGGLKFHEDLLANIGRHVLKSNKSQK